MKTCTLVMEVKEDGVIKEINIITGGYAVCFASKQVAKQKEKEFRRSGKIPHNASITYKIQCHDMTRKKV